MSGCSLDGYSFKDTTVWSSQNDSKCLRLGISVLKISNLPKAEVEWTKFTAEKETATGLLKHTSRG